MDAIVDNIARTLGAGRHDFNIVRPVRTSASKFGLTFSEVATAKGLISGDIELIMQSRGTLNLGFRCDRSEDGVPTMVYEWLIRVLTTTCST